MLNNLKGKFNLKELTNIKGAIKGMFADKNTNNSEFICPYCYSKYNKTEYEYMCGLCGNEIYPTETEKMNIVSFYSGNKNSSLAVYCPKCGVNAIRKCPKCKQDLPWGLVACDGNLQISIVGTSGSGKTNYITVLMEEFRKMRGLNIQGVDNDTITTQEKNWEKMNVSKRSPLTTNTGDEKPQVWSVQNMNKTKGNYTPTYVLSIFDGAGESHENLGVAQKNQALAKSVSYIRTSKALVLTIDPTLFSCINPNPTKSVQRTIDNLINYIKSSLGIGGSAIDIPAAVVITKFDLVINHPTFSPSARASIQNTANLFENGELNMTVINTNSRYIEDWLDKYGIQGFAQYLKNNFSQVKFFGVSSYGSSAPAGKTPDRIEPFRVLDPFLWLMSEMDIINKKN